MLTLVSVAAMTWTVERCLREDPRLSRADLDYLKEWHKKQPHLPPMTDIQFIKFLHCNYYSLEKCKVCIDKYFTLRTHAPDMFSNRDVLLPVNAAQEQFTLVVDIPKRDCNGYRVIGLGLQPAADLSDLVPARAALVAFAMMDLLVREWPICPGYTFVLDAANLQLGHIAKASVPLLKKMLTYVQEAAPIRMKIVHVININPVVEKVMLLIKPFLGEELQKMLKFHSGSMESFYEALPRDMLPHEFGGTSGSAVEYHRKLFKQLKEKREELIEEEKLQQVNENLRPGRAKDAGEVFGMEGSFKKLDID
ncbi:Alpha-tocopherol transfer protein-like protein [Gryllus bimaculatus]|nr:Alpha-tocopherol transfer protein-like protein [Gryllus bimaculatus]